MCNPGIVLAMVVAGSAMTAVDKIRQGKQGNALAEYNAQMAERQAELANEQARHSLEQGKLEEEKSRRGSALFKSEQVSSLAASGIELDSGSPLELLADTAKMAELDAQSIRYQAQYEAWGHQNNAQNMLSEAGLSRYKAKQGQANSISSFGKSLIGGTGSFANSYQRFYG